MIICSYKTIKPPGVHRWGEQNLCCLLWQWPTAKSNENTWTHIHHPKWDPEVPTLMLNQPTIIIQNVFWNGWLTIFFPSVCVHCSKSALKYYWLQLKWKKHTSTTQLIGLLRELDSNNKKFEIQCGRRLGVVLS